MKKLLGSMIVRAEYYKKALTMLIGFGLDPGMKDRMKKKTTQI